jgi:dipeptidase E
MDFKTALIIFLVLIIISLLFHTQIRYAVNRFLFYKTISLPPKKRKRNLLLVSNSKEKVFGKETYFNHCRSNIAKFLKSFKVKRVLFIPYAGANVAPLGVPKDPKKYSEIVEKEIFKPLGIKVVSIDNYTNSYDKQAEILRAECIFIAGGNAFKLLHELARHDIIDAIRMAVFSGIPYIGCSSGVVACNPTLHTSRSIPIMNLRSFKSLDLIPFYINVHYYDGLGSRLNQYLLRNPKEKILAIEEGVVVHIVGDKGEMVGFGGGEIIERKGGKLLRKGLTCGSNISSLLKVT